MLAVEATELGRGGVSVGQQPAPTRRRRERPRPHRPQPQHRRPSRHPDRLDRITNRSPSRSDRSQQRIEIWANTVNQTRTIAALTAKRRSQPRTVDTGTPTNNAASR